MTSIPITLNGASTESSTRVLLELVAAVTGRDIDRSGRPADGGRLGVAAAVNAEVVPRRAWAATALEPGDDVEIITAVQGG